MDSGWYEQFDFIGDLMERVAQNRVWMVHPDKTIATVGDSEPKPVSIDWPTSSDSCLDSKASRYLLETSKSPGYDYPPRLGGADAEGLDAVRYGDVFSDGPQVAL